MKRLSIFTCLLLGLMLTVSAQNSSRKQLFNDNWLFCLNDSDFSKSQSVTLPHDWSIRQSFDQKAPAGNDGGYLPTGRGWYKKTLTLGAAQQDKRLRLYFEGVYMNAHVYVNGQLAGGWPYGYTSFWVDVTKFVHQGQNEIIVSVDNSQQKNCRWYSGSGIYRNVWLYTTPMTYIDEWSVCVTNPDTHTVKIKADVVEEQGNRTPIERTIHIDQPHLWSPADPYLYETELTAGDDRLSISYGLRTISFDAQQGLLLNNQPLRLNGACLHHDNGILGAAAFDAAERRKAELIKAAGFNAVRTSHNPPSETFLRACDELGLLVIDEAFDGWREQKNTHDYHELIDQWWKRDLGAMIRRDRNHPSVFCWSIGNEVIERKKIEVVKTAHQMATLCRELDPQHRPVTSALAAWDDDWDIYDPLAAEHDIVGYNYMIHKSESDHQRVPNRVMMQTESYPRDAWNNFQKVMNEPYVIGDFVWTGLDYIGESGIGRWYYEKLRVGDEMSGKGDVPGEHYERPLYPWHAAYCGDVLALMPGTFAIAAAEDAAYNNGSLKITKSITLRSAKSSDRAIIKGRITLENGASLDLNQVIIDATETDGGQIFNFTAEGEFDHLNIQDCEIIGASGQKGFCYVNVAAAINNITINNCLIRDIECNGGDLFDCRKGYIKSFTLTNSTLWKCATSRDIFRYDDASGSFPGVEAPNFTVDHCTFVDCGNGNANYRFFYLRFAGNKITFTNNLVTGFNNKRGFANQASTDQAPTLSGNYYWNTLNLVSPAEGNTEKISWFDEEGQNHVEDPGFADAANGDFTVSNEEIKYRGAGDPRWIK